MSPLQDVRGPASLDEAIQWLRKHFDAEAAGGLSVVYRFDLGGAGGGSFAVRVSRGRLEVDPSGDEAAEVRFRLAAADFFAILSGRANAELLFMEDRIAVDGDLSLALRARRLFRPRG